MPPTKLTVFAHANLSGLSEKAGVLTIYLIICETVSSLNL